MKTRRRVNMVINRVKFNVSISKERLMPTVGPGHRGLLQPFFEVPQAASISSGDTPKRKAVRLVCVVAGYIGVAMVEVPVPGIGRVILGR